MALGCAVVFGIAPPQWSAADELQLTLHSGTVITADVAATSLQWTTVRRNGELSTQPFELSEIGTLILSTSSASRQVSAVRRWLTNLGSPDYLERQEAESKLSEAQTGGRFKSLIKTFRDHEKYEVRHRVARILDRLDKTDEELNTEFDLLTLKNGRPMEGDASDFQLNCTYRGRSFSLTRSEIRMLKQPAKTGNPDVAATPVNVSLFHSHEGEFYLPNQIKIDFETSPNGAEIKRSTNVDDLYVPMGLRLGVEGDGNVGVSGFGFDKFAPLPPVKNSVCVFQKVGNYTKRFRGILEIQFCMPGQKSVPAGVHEFGLFIARVSHSRDFIVEAYNQHGQLLASVEATDNPCVFAGIKSNEPITKIRILANPYLFRVKRTIFDEDYAIDDICFSPPVAVSSPVNQTPTNVRLRNGDLLKCTRFKVTGADSFVVDVLDESDIELTLEDVASIRFGQKPATGKKHWAAMHQDGSILHVTPGDRFRCLSFDSLSFSNDDIKGLWWSRSPARYPEATDFENGPTVMVFPTCRIATEVKFSDSGFSWSEQAKKLQQPVHTGQTETVEDPTVRISSIQYAKASPENIPTLWKSPPQTDSPGVGRIRLADGQQLVIGGSLGFKIDSFQEKSVTISVAGKQTTLPFSQVLSIQFPSSQ